MDTTTRNTSRWRYAKPDTFYHEEDGVTAKPGHHLGEGGTEGYLRPGNPKEDGILGGALFNGWVENFYRCEANHKDAFPYTFFEVTEDD